MNRLAAIITLALCLLTFGLIKVAKADFVAPPLEYLMYGVSQELNGNWAVAYDIDNDGEWDISFLHHKISVTREYNECGEPVGNGRDLYVWSGCGEGQTPLLYTLNSNYIAVRKPGQIWSWYIKSTWPAGNAPCRRLYSFVDGGCK